MNNEDFKIKKLYGETRNVNLLNTNLNYEMQYMFMRNIRRNIHNLMIYYKKTVIWKMYSKLHLINCVTVNSLVISLLGWGNETVLAESTKIISLYI